MNTLINQVTTAFVEEGMQSNSCGDLDWM